MGSQALLFAFICFLASFQAFECKTLGRERKARNYECKPSEGNSCWHTICEGNRQKMVVSCTCPNMVNYRCPCIDNNGIRQKAGSKFIYQHKGESLYCGCDMGDSGYCKRGCVDHNGKKHEEGILYDFIGANGKYSCNCKEGKAQCSKGFTIPDIDSNRPPPVLPPRPGIPPHPGMPALPPHPPLPPRPGMPVLPPRPPQLPPRP